MPRKFNSIVEFGRFVRFGLVGLLNFFVYSTMTLISIELFGFFPVVGSLIGQAVSVVVTYVGHLSYSFKVEANHRTYLWRFATVIAILFAANVGIMWLLTDLLDLPHRISVAVVTFVIPLMSYLLNRFWVFLPGLEGALMWGDPKSGQARDESNRK